MTVVGAGGLIIRTIQLTRRFERDFEKLPPEFKKLCSETLPKLLENPRLAAREGCASKNCKDTAVRHSILCTLPAITRCRSK
jgi:hypothetical protein